MTSVQPDQYWMFLDGSGKEHSHACVAYCGYLSEVDNTEVFGEQWSSLLLREHLPWFSMKDALSWSAPFDKKRVQWGDDAEAKRHALLLEMADTIRNGKMVGFGNAAFVPAYKKQIPPTEFFLFTRVLELLLAQISDNSYVAIVVDEEERYAERIYGLFRELRKKKPELARPLKLVGIADDKAFPGLQAADMLARAVMGEMDRRAKRPSDPPDEMYVRLTSSFASKSLHVSELYDDPNEFLKIARIV
jgi:hypothetical protein